MTFREGNGNAVVDWPGALRQAATEEDIVNVVRDYLATWSPEEIACLPPDCRPGRIRDGEDVSQLAFQLASTHCAASLDGPGEALLEKLLAFVTQAAARVAEVKAVPAEPA